MSAPNNPFAFPPVPLGTHGAGGDGARAEPLGVSDVLQRLHKVARSGSGYVACCPAHEDHEASMTVGEGEDGRVLVYCHRGCSFEEIASALAVPAASLCGPDAAADVPNDPKPPAEDYDYEDERGTLLFRVSRFYKQNAAGEWKKQFAQKRHLGEGQFARNMDGAERTVYNLPAVRAAVAVGEPVYVVEGEKDVHTLRGWGLAATCNPGGAGKWDPDYGRALRGADVVVLPDNDAPGRRHGETVAASARLFAASVVVLDLPDLPEKGDVTDWVRLGHTQTELAALVARRGRLGPDDDGFDADMAPRPLVDLPVVSADALATLPTLLRELCSHYETGIDKTIALTSAAAVLSGMLPNTRVSHYDKDYGLHLMFCLVARSGAGKAILDHVERLVHGVDRQVKENAQYEIEGWDTDKRQLKRGETMDTERPFPRTYLLPANASKTFLIRGLAASKEIACIVETEIDSFVGANEQEWGDSTDLVRKAFHHEAYRMGRIGTGSGETLAIERPSLALALSGTWKQFDRLFEANVDNGFFNRFCFLVSNTALEFRSQRPSPRTFRREAWYATATARVTDLFCTFESRSTSLTVGIDEAGWDRIDAVFEPAFRAASDTRMSDRLLPVVQRVNLMTVRLVGLLTVLRADDFGMDLVTTPHLVAAETDVRLALHIASIWYTHAAALLSHLTADSNRANPLVLLSDDCRALYAALPETFKRAEANEAGRGLEIADRSVKRHLQHLQEAGLVLRDGHAYQKATPAPTPQPFAAGGASVGGSE